MTNPSDNDIRTILTSARTIAVVGASANPQRASHGIMKMLMRAGYRVIPVNPNESEILGEKAYPSLSAIPEKIDIVDVFRRAEDTPPVAIEAAKIGATTLWLQLGIVNEQAATTAREAGMNVVMDACIAVEMGRLNIAGPA